MNHSLLYMKSSLFVYGYHFLSSMNDHYAITGSQVVALWLVLLLDPVNVNLL